MLFSRRRQATTVEPGAPDASAPANGSPRDDTRGETPTVELTPPLIDVGATPTSGDNHHGPRANGETPSVEHPPISTEVAAVPPASGDETADADLERFFAALRQVVHDARERLPLADEPLDDGTPGDPTAAAMVPTRPDLVTTTELSSSTEELIASLEADRDIWRERAVVWRERALGAGMLVKTLNEHVSDLGINLEDLRMAMRAMSVIIQAQPEPRASLPAQTPPRRGPDRSLGSGD